MRKPLLLLAAIAVMVLVAGCADDEPSQGPVTISTEIDFSAEPIRGTFEVTEVADILGCDTGTFVDTPSALGVHKDFTCETGAKEGTFTARFLPQDIPGPGDQNGPWSILEATQDFNGLEGEGDFSVVFNDAEESGVETFTGEIQSSP